MKFTSCHNIFAALTGSSAVRQHYWIFRRKHWHILIIFTFTFTISCYIFLICTFTIVLTAKWDKIHAYVLFLYFLPVSAKKPQPKIQRRPFMPAGYLGGPLNYTCVYNHTTIDEIVKRFCVPNRVSVDCLLKFLALSIVIFLISRFCDNESVWPKW